jgi:hypothetical protein
MVGLPSSSSYLTLSIYHQDWTYRTLNDLAPEAISSPRMPAPISTPKLGISQGTPALWLLCDQDAMRFTDYYLTSANM